ncbi:transglycosylase family protein [Sphingomonas turrisvirgatae]|uniref:Uncharacterized protein n=1 Tax=Sphingomonas turrisvirgatae TaxID=1888892 RepID=A0A1E3M2G3_9SPHN|nr:transglycosylase family protein [Sphingomonas turrisvirgatae]ODP39250.1 hypothetical protein BFL28_10580 [Sphingomonas turrisvirgatae]
MFDQRDPSSYADAPDVASFPLAQQRDMPQPGWGDLFRAQREVTAGEMPTAEYDRTWEAWEPVLEELNRSRPRGERRLGNPALGKQRQADGTWRDSFHGPNRQELEERAWGEVERARRANPKAFPTLPKTLAEFRSSILENAKQRREQAQAVLERNGEWGGSIASLAGGVVEGFRDPINLMTLSVGGFGKSAAIRMLTEGLVNAGIEGLEQPLVAEQKRAFGEETTAGDVVENVVTAFVGGAAFQGASEVVEGVARAAGRKLNPIDKQLAKALADGEVPEAMLPELYRRHIGVDRMTPTEKAAVDLIEREAQIDATNPFQPGPGREAHAEKLAEAMRNLAAPESPAAATSAAASPALTRAAPPPAMEGGAALKAKIRRVESGGNDTAANPRSSAYGRYQFTAPTWRRYYTRRYGSQGLADAQILAKRSDPAVQERLMDDLIADNTAALARVGARPTAGNLYLMHFAGQGGAQAILRAAPDTPIERVLGEGAVKANPFLRGKTAEDVIEWAHAKMGGEVPSGPVLQREGFGTDEEWLAAQRQVDAAEADLARAQQDDEFAARALEAADAPDMGEPRVRAIDPAEEPGQFDLLPLDDPISARRFGADELDPATTYFVTAKGSTYRVEPDGTTTRDKAYRPEHGEAEQGLQPPSERTWFVSLDDAIKLGELQARGGDPVELAEMPDGRIGLRYISGKDAGKFERRTVVQPQSSPATGLIPVESWQNGRRVHFGNTITEVRRGGAALPPSRVETATRSVAEREIVAPDMPSAQRQAEAGEVAEQLRTYDDPVPSALREATDSLEHDILMAVDRGDLADLQVRIGEDGDPVNVRSVLDGLEKDTAAISAARACMVPNKGTANVAG